MSGLERLRALGSRFEGLAAERVTVTVDGRPLWRVLLDIAAQIEREHAEPGGLTLPGLKVPPLDADGAEIRAGDVLYSVETGESVTVESVEPGNPWFAATSGTLQHCGKFTHRAPVIVADGKPLHAGETVYKVDGDGTAYVFDGMSDYVDELAMLHRKDKPYVGTGLRVDQLTHERPDSWERLEEDVANASCPDVYCANHHIDASDASYEWAMARDIVRRAKKLAERDR